MTGFFWVIAVLSMIGLAVSWSGPSARAQNKQTEHFPPTQNTDSAQKAANERADSSSVWRKYKGKIESNEKFITATSTIFIAAFTVLLAFATFFLWSATRELVDDAKSNSERQLRAYIFPHEMRVTDVDIGGRPTADIVVKNTGLTPATNVISWAGIWVGNFPLQAQLSRANSEFMKSASRRSAGPGATFSIAPVWSETLTEQHMRMLRNGTAAVFVWGEITYVDVFGQKRITSFHSYYGGDMGLRPDGATTTSPEGNNSD